MIRRNLILSVDYVNNATEAVVTYIDEVVETYTDPADFAAIQQQLKVQLWQQKVTGANSIAN